MTSPLRILRGSVHVLTDRELQKTPMLLFGSVGKTAKSLSKPYGQKTTGPTGSAGGTEF